MYMDLRSYMNLSPQVVKESTSFSEAYHIFRSMGLRHLIVINGYDKIYIMGIFMLLLIYLLF